MCVYIYIYICMYKWYIIIFAGEIDPFAAFFASAGPSTECLSRTVEVVPILRSMLDGWFRTLLHCALQRGLIIPTSMGSDFRQSRIGKESWDKRLLTQNKEPHSAMNPEIRYQQPMHLKEDRWSSPSASFHAATGIALTSGNRLCHSLCAT